MRMIKQVAVYIALVVMIIPSSGQAFGLTTLADHPLMSEKPEWFLQDGEGGFYGKTESGLDFTQKTIAAPYPVRIQRFNIGDIFFYISDRGIIEAPSDLAAVSVYLTLG
jgi:hypothetical protein